MILYILSFMPAMVKLTSNSWSKATCKEGAFFFVYEMHMFNIVFFFIDEPKEF